MDILLGRCRGQFGKHGTNWGDLTRAAQHLWCLPCAPQSLSVLFLTEMCENLWSSTKTVNSWISARARLRFWRVLAPSLWVKLPYSAAWPLGSGGNSNKQSSRTGRDVNKQSGRSRMVLHHRKMSFTAFFCLGAKLQPQNLWFLPCLFIYKM